MVRNRFVSSKSARDGLGQGNTSLGCCPESTSGADAAPYDYASVELPEGSYPHASRTSTQLPIGLTVSSEGGVAEPVAS